MVCDIEKQLLEIINIKEDNEMEEIVDSTRIRGILTKLVEGTM